MKKETIWEKVKWELFMYKMRFYILQDNLKYKLLKLIHCNKGFHYFEKKFISLTKTYKDKSRKWRSDYFECKVCGLIEFTTKKDLWNYKIINKCEDDNIKLLVKEIVNGKK